VPSPKVPLVGLRDGDAPNVNVAVEPRVREPLVVNVVKDGADIVVPFKVKLLASVTLLPIAVNAVVPFGAKTTFPVPVAPRESVWLLVVANNPFP